MATFTIKRGDTAPPLQISLSIAGTSPREYWSAGADKPDGVNTREIKQVKFIMKGDDNKIVGATSQSNYTGIARSDTANNKTVLTYSWGPNDTAVAGTYSAEFEVVYKDARGGDGKKRTFPSTSGDTLIINVTPDLNDEA